MHEGQCSAAQTIVNKALRALMGCRQKDMSISVAAMWREFDIAPVYAMACARRARAARKFPSLKTWVATLGKYDHVGSKQRAWMAASRAWLKRFFHEKMEMEMGGDEMEEGMIMRSGGGPLDREVLEDRWKMYEKRKRWAAAEAYITRGYGETSWASVKSIPMCGRAEQVRIGQGLRLLSLCRTNGLWTAKKRAGAKFIHGRYKKLCPCCGIVGEGETVEHILMSCQRWEKERRQHMGRVFDDIKGMGLADEERGHHTAWRGK